MNDKKRPMPKVDVVVRPGASAAGVRPRAVSPSPAPAPSVVTPEAPAKPGAAPTARPASPRPSPPRSFPPRAASPHPPPTEAQVEALARTERVPARIARGALEGRMPCKIWRKLHAEEARRFDQVYVLLSQHPELGLQEAFGLAQAGVSVEEWKERRESAARKQAVRSARAGLSNEAVAAWFAAAVGKAAPFWVMEADRAHEDVLTAEAPVELTFSGAGRLEKLRVVMLGPVGAWSALEPTLARDPALAAHPAPLHRQPEKRPVNDARPLAPHVGAPVQLLLRNGWRLSLPLRAVGPFDLLVEAGEGSLLVPLHALVGWAPDGAPPPSAG